MTINDFIQWVKDNKVPLNYEMRTFHTEYLEYNESEPEIITDLSSIPDDCRNIPLPFVCVG